MVFHNFQALRVIVYPIIIVITQRSNNVFF